MNLNTKNITGVIFGASAVIGTTISPASGYEAEIVQAHMRANSSSYSVTVRDTPISGSSFDTDCFLGTSNYTLRQDDTIKSKIFDYEEDLNIKMKPVRSFTMKARISKITKATPKISISELT